MTYPTDEQVEAAARAIADVDASPGWREANPDEWKDCVEEARAALRAAGPVLDREVVKRKIIEYVDSLLAMPDSPDGPTGPDPDAYTDAILASAMTREGVRREVIEGLVKKALSDASDLCRERYLGDERAKALRYLADWLRSQLGG